MSVKKRGGAGRKAAAPTRLKSLQVSTDSFLHGGSFNNFLRVPVQKVKLLGTTRLKSVGAFSSCDGAGHKTASVHYFPLPSCTVLCGFLDMQRGDSEGKGERREKETTTA